MRDRQEEVDNNYEAFEKLLSAIIDEHKGEYALMKNMSIISYHKSFYEADEAGQEKYKDGIYSIQKVDEEPINLGYFSYV